MIYLFCSQRILKMWFTCGFTWSGINSINLVVYVQWGAIMKMKKCFKIEKEADKAQKKAYT